MEQKALKAQVFTNDIIFNESAELPIDVDFMLPDYCPDIVKLLKCKAEPMPATKNVGSGIITVEGIIKISIIYSDSENDLCSYDYQFPFSKSFETDINCDGASLSVRTKCEYLNCRAVTGRKIDIHGAAGIYVRLLKRCCQDIIADFDDSATELLRGKVPATTPMGTVEKYMTIEEEVEIGAAQPPIRALLRCESDAIIRETKLLNGKNVIRGELCIGMLYCPVEGGPQKVRATLPFSQLMELSGANDTCSLDTKAEIVCIDIKPRVSASGEAKSFIVSAKLLIITNAFCELDIDVVLDAYSRKYASELKHKELSFEKVSRTIDETALCKAQLDFPENALASIIDVWCEVTSSACKADQEKLTVYGSLIASIIAHDSKGIPFLYEKAIEYTYDFTIDELGKVNCEPAVEVKSCNYTLMSDNSLELRVELGIRAAIRQMNEVTLISDLSIDEKIPLNHENRGAMTIYFASMGENLWDISRRYHASVNDVKSINNIGDLIDADKMIMIPIG